MTQVATAPAIEIILASPASDVETFAIRFPISAVTQEPPPRVKAIDDPVVAAGVNV